MFSVPDCLQSTMTFLHIIPSCRTVTKVHSWLFWILGPAHTLVARHRQLLSWDVPHLQHSLHVGVFMPPTPLCAFESIVAYNYSLPRKMAYLGEPPLLLGCSCGGNLPDLHLCPWDLALSTVVFGDGLSLFLQPQWVGWLQLCASRKGFWGTFHG